MLPVPETEHDDEMRRVGVIAFAAAVVFAAGFFASHLVGAVDPTYRLGRLETSVDAQQRTLNEVATKLDVAISRLEDVGSRLDQTATQMRQTEEGLNKLELKITALDAEMRADESALEARGFLSRGKIPRHEGE
jgi:septal ring factor EnvC (AmiA/AmiB activator)